MEMHTWRISLGATVILLLLSHVISVSPHSPRFIQLRSQSKVEATRPCFEYRVADAHVKWHGVVSVKVTGLFHSWEKRYFKVTPQFIMWWNTDRAPVSSAPSGSIELENVQIRTESGSIILVSTKQCCQDGHYKPCVVTVQSSDISGVFKSAAEEAQLALNEKWRAVSAEHKSIDIAIATWNQEMKLPNNDAAKYFYRNVVSGTPDLVFVAEQEASVASHALKQGPILSRAFAGKWDTFETTYTDPSTDQYTTLTKSPGVLSMEYASKKHSVEVVRMYSDSSRQSLKKLNKGGVLMYVHVVKHDHTTGFYVPFRVLVIGAHLDTGDPQATVTSLLSSTHFVKFSALADAVYMAGDLNYRSWTKRPLDGPNATDWTCGQIADVLQQAALGPPPALVRAASAAAKSPRPSRASLPVTKDEVPMSAEAAGPEPEEEYSFSPFEPLQKLDSVPSAPWAAHFATFPLDPAAPPSYKRSYKKDQIAFRHACIEYDRFNLEGELKPADARLLGSLCYFRRDCLVANDEPAAKSDDLKDYLRVMKIDDNRVPTSAKLRSIGGRNVMELGWLDRVVFYTNHKMRVGPPARHRVPIDRPLLESTSMDADIGSIASLHEGNYRVDIDSFDDGEDAGDDPAGDDPPPPMSPVIARDASARVESLLETSRTFLRTIPLVLSDHLPAMVHHSLSYLE